MMIAVLCAAVGAVLHDNRLSPVRERAMPSAIWDWSANTTDGGHRLGTTQGACSSSLSWCTNPDPALKESNDHRCKGAGPTPCFSGLAQWQIDRVVQQHNKVRAHHGACPVTYSKEIEKWTVASTGFKNTCTNRKLEHNSNRYINGVYLGENLFGASSSGGGTSGELENFDPLSAIKAWYCNEEGCWDYAKSSGSGTTGHFTQVVWKASLEIGCGLCHSKSASGWTNLYFMCNYRVGGNMGGAYAANVGSVGSKATGCKAVAPTPAPGKGQGEAPGPKPPASDDGGSGVEAWVIAVAVVGALVVVAAIVALVCLVRRKKAVADSEGGNAEDTPKEGEGAAPYN
eukprot:TRINITY_DN346_c0_g1_i13.p1 TRINITY_DN346_c0_g1~~TRINITY_DN346_c0_g1_i13.p1  ORF type:complete len:343 (+),score=80.55 TRINITY_DN346_c0_g1_i13:48-1076(+)